MNRFKQDLGRRQQIPFDQSAEEAAVAVATDTSIITRAATARTRRMRRG